MTAWTLRLADELDSLAASLSVSGVESPVRVENIRLLLDRLKEADVDPHESIGTLLSRQPSSVTAGVRDLLRQHPTLRDNLNDWDGLYMAIPRGQASLSLEDMVDCLVKHAVVTSGIETAEHFDRYISLAEDCNLPCAEVTTVEGLSADKPYEIFPGLDVLPLDHAVDAGLMEKGGKESLASRSMRTKWTAMACIVRRATFGPAVIPPQQSQAPDLTVFNVAFEWAKESLSLVLAFLSLANNSRVRQLGTTIAVPEFHGLHPFFGRARMPPEPRKFLLGKTGELTQDSVDHLRGMLQRLAAFPEKERPRLELAAHRLASALSRTDGSFPVEDSILDVSIALEILYGLVGGGEIQHKLATRLAHFLGASAAERYELFKGVRSLYTTRSNIAHGRDSTDAKTDEVFNSALNMALRSFSRLLERQALPSSDEWLKISVGVRHA